MPTRVQDRMTRPVRALALACAVAAVTGCAGSPPSSPSRATSTSTKLETALRTNPNDEATSAACAPATVQDRARHTFGRTRAPLFVCTIRLVRAPARAEAFDVQVLHNGCFIAERIRRGQADYGCIRP
jgi:hypothetical protein